MKRMIRRKMKWRTKRWMMVDDRDVEEEEEEEEEEEDDDDVEDR